MCFLPDLRVFPSLFDRLFALGYVAGPAGVAAMAIADKKGRTGQPLSEEGVDDRAYRESLRSHFALVHCLSLGVRTRLRTPTRGLSVTSTWLASARYCT